MANYGYIPFAAFEKDAEDEAACFERDLKIVVKKVLGDRWSVRLCNYEDGGPTWAVYLPGTAPEPTKTQGIEREDIGFPVSLQPGQVAFRHAGLGPCGEFARWAQGCVEEELAEHWGLGIEYDATDRIVPPGTREYRVGKTFREYKVSQFEPLSPEDERYLEDRYKKAVPDGFW